MATQALVIIAVTTIALAFSIIATQFYQGSLQPIPLQQPLSQFQSVPPMIVGLPPASK